MREATPEEQQSVNDYIESISISTGVKFFEEQNKNKQKKHDKEDGR